MSSRPRCDEAGPFVALFKICITLVLIVASAHSARAASTFDEIKSAHRPSDTLILDRHGELLHRLRTDASVRRGQWVALADVSPALRTALVLSEDKRFYEHSGVDWQAVSAAAWANLWNTKTRGASTLTMQLAGLLDDDLKRRAGGRSLLQKVQQTVSAEWLEQRLRKDQILEAYLNLVPFRGELVGIDALSQTLFGKAAHGLDAREAAVAVALLRAPNAKPDQVAQRACTVLKSLQSIGATLGCEAMAFFTTAVLQRREYPASEGLAPHVAQQLTAAVQRSAAASSQAATPTASTTAASNAPLAPTLRTTLSAPLQRFAVQTLQQHLRELAGRHVEDAALVVLDNRSGQVLAWVGSSAELSSAAEVDGVTALRQPGSTLKPFLYAQAIAERRLTAASLLEDSSTQIQTSGGLYIPQNYDRQFKGWVSARTALAASLNVPAVHTLVMVSPDAFHKQLVKLGLPLRETGDYHGYSLALGSAEVSLLALTNAYRALANGGRVGPTYLTLPVPATAAGASANVGVKKPITPVLDPRAAFIVTDVLSDPLARARTFGLDSVLATRFWTAVKTGTSKDMRDNWAVGYSQTYTVGVWVGNASGAPMWDVSGSSGAAPIWAAVMNHLHARLPSRAPAAPAGLVHQMVQLSTSPHSNAPAVEASRQEWFLQGSQQARFALNTGASPAETVRAGSQNDLKFLRPSKSDRSAPALGGAAPTTLAARITSPTNGSIIALDPDIPPQRQRVALQAEGRNLRWQIDGKPLARGASALWLPWPGRHVVQLLDASGLVQDEVRLEVRGAGVRQVSVPTPSKGAVKAASAVRP
ncbi:MAG: penicillin-binding protein 1C [Comamonadaceae bacterium]|nr:penicillin-binding protein 1C [Comamonadaceae bacterium]